MTEKPENKNRNAYLFVQWNLSIMVTLGPDISGLYIQVVVEKPAYGSLQHFSGYDRYQ